MSQQFHTKLLYKHTVTAIKLDNIIILFVILCEIDPQSHDRQCQFRSFQRYIYISPFFTAQNRKPNSNFPGEQRSPLLGSCAEWRVVPYQNISSHWK